MDPGDEQEWLDEQEESCVEYLKAHGVNVAEPLDIEWLIGPKVALWSTQVGRHKVWLISGDVPNDHVSDPSLTDPRKAMLAICKRWEAASAVMMKGQVHPQVKIGAGASPQQLIELGDLLGKRAKLLGSWAADDEKWEQGLQ
jgi:hypothetical protein